MAQLLMRTDPFREFDRLAQQLFRGNGTLAYPGAMPMDAWREGTPSWGVRPAGHRP